MSTLKDAKQTAQVQTETLSKCQREESVEKVNYFMSHLWAIYFLMII